MRQPVVVLGCFLGALTTGPISSAWAGGVARHLNQAEEAPDHPKLLFDANDVTSLRGAASSTHAEIWNEIERFTEENLAKAPPDLRFSSDGGYADHAEELMVFAFAALIAEDARYLDLTQRWVKAAMVPKDWVPFIAEGPGFGSGHMLWAFSLTYDMLYDRISPTAREALLRKVRTEGNRLLEASRGGMWWARADGQNENWVNNAALGIAGLTFRRELGPDAEAWLAQSVANFDRVLLDLSHIPDGSYTASTNYYWDFALQPTLLFLDARRRLEGVDSFDNPWLRATLTWRLYVTLPDRLSTLPIADTYVGWVSPFGVIRQLAAEYGDGHGEWMVQQALPRSRGTRSRAVRAPFEFIYYEPSLPAKSPEDLPPSVLFKDWGVAVMRTGWGTEDLYLTLKSGAPGGRFRFDQSKPTADAERLAPGHDHPDQNSFFFYNRGVPIAVDPGYQMPKYSADHNTVLIDSQGQIGEGKTWFDRDAPDLFDSDGAITAFAATPHFDYVNGDASRSYPRSLDLRYFGREIVFVKPHYFLMIDTLQSDTPHRFEYLMQNVQGSYGVLGKWVVGTSFDQNTYTHVLAPSSFAAVVEEIEPVSNWLQPDGLPGTWHRINIAPSAPTASARFITFHAPGKLPRVNMLRGDGLMRIAVTGDGFDDSVLVADPGSISPYEIEDFRTDAQVSIVTKHEEGGGLRQRYYIMNGRYLEVGGVVRIQGGVPGATVEATLSADVLAVTYLFPDGVDADVLKVFAPDVTTVVVNGAPASFSRDGSHVVFPVQGQVAADLGLGAPTRSCPGRHCASARPDSARQTTPDLSQPARRRLDWSLMPSRRRP